MIVESASAQQLPSAFDSAVSAGQLLVAATTYLRLQGSTRQGWPHSSSSPCTDLDADLFRDETHAEVQRLEPVVAELTKRVSSLLQEWPEHPALQLVQQLCDRLQSFRADSPLMKFITGTELLLKRCWEWEEVACRATSIKSHIDSLTKLLLRWRKMEVEAWPSLLRRAASTQHEAALLQVWARLFRVVNSHGTVSDDTASEGAKATAATGEGGVEKEVPTSLQTSGAAAGNALAVAERQHLHDFFDVFQQLMLGAEAGAFE
eukprot:5924020-Pleurochrysis_carterae.AAC.1